MWTREDLIRALSSESGFSNIGQLDRKTAAWLSRQRRAGRVVEVAWNNLFGRTVWGFAA